MSEMRGAHGQNFFGDGVAAVEPILSSSCRPSRTRARAVPGDSGVLVVGGTSILAPAADCLRARGARVLVVARRRRQGKPQPWATFDARVASEWSSHVTAPDGWAGTSVIAYEPALSAASLAVLTAQTVRPRVLVRPSAAAAPNDGNDVEAMFQISEITGWIQVILGWHSDGSWHDPVDISLAALEAWGTHRSCVLGRVRPWEGWSS